jgi:Bacterial lectin/Immunoglobulin I-set domain
MKSKLIPILLTCFCAGLVRADFNPIELTPNSYTERIIVPADTVQALPGCITVTAGDGLGLGDNTYYEQGLYSRPGTPGYNSGVPIHDTVFTNINNPNMLFQMPPDYTTNNDLMIDSDHPSGTFTFATPTTATNLAILCCGGGGSTVIAYTVTNSDGSTESGTLNLPDWFAGGSTVAWGANGRVTSGGTYNNYNSSSVNNNPPYLYGNTITVSDASPVSSITLTYTSGAHGNFFAVSGNDGAGWKPVPVSGFNEEAIVPAANPFPVTATMDLGTNLVDPGNNWMSTFFYQGFDRAVSVIGLPTPGTLFSSLSQPTHNYEFADNSTNDSILIDTNHQIVNITPLTPASYTALAFLTAGGNEGAGNIMTNLCIVEHQDGVNETNLFYGHDWFDDNYPGSVALNAGGRVNLNSRNLQNIGDSDGTPHLFESYFLLDDSSPVTNILAEYKTAPNAVCTTFVMALSGATGSVAPIIDQGPIPLTQTVYPGTNVTLFVHTIGTQPITGQWEEEIAGTYVPLTDGVNANGSIISGSQTTTLTISNIFMADGTNYEYVAQNSVGTGTSTPATIIVNPQAISITPASPVVAYTGNNIPLTVNLSPGPAVGLQWFYVDDSGVTNMIPDATNVTYTITDASTAINNYYYGVIAANVYGTNTAMVQLNIGDSPAFLNGNLTPTNAEAYAGAPVTYTVHAEGNTPINYQWIVNGSVLNGVNTNSYTIATPCGMTTIQVLFTNALSGGTAVATAVAQLQGDPNPTNITFNSDGTGWQTNGSVPNITTNVFTLTDGNGGEASSGFYKTAQYVGGAWTASYTYNSHGGGADGTAFVIQNVGPTALGGGGGELGYTGITNSMAFEIDIYGGPGIAFATNGNTGSYVAPGTVDVTTDHDIAVKLNWSNGVLGVSMTDMTTMDTFTTNYMVGSLSSILGGNNIAYIGFTGGDGGVASIQTVSNFQFHSVLPPVSLSVSPVSDNKVTLSWPASDPNYVLQMTPSLSSPSWVVGPAPTTSNGVSQVTVDVSGGGQEFYRLQRVVCQ